MTKRPFVGDGVCPLATTGTDPEACSLYVVIVVSLPGSVMNVVVAVCDAHVTGILAAASLSTRIPDVRSETSLK